MGISLREMRKESEEYGEVFTIREVALNRGFEYLPFAFRELVTPQEGVVPRSEEIDEEVILHHYENPTPAERVRWANWLDDFPEEDAIRLEPASAEMTRRAMVDLLRKDGTNAEIRAVGSGHSHSNAAEPSRWFIDMSARGKLPHSGWLAVNEDRSTDGVTYIRNSGVNEDFERSNLVRVRAGTVLKRLNRNILPDHGDDDATSSGKALKNMGSWDGQTLAGAINTGTHGTGMRLGSLADVVKSVEIATVPESESGVPLVQRYRIEPAGGITDREKFEADTDTHGMELIQDDDVFYSAVVGYGCMGIVTAYTIRVRDAYWLREEANLYQWKELGDKVTARNPNPALPPEFLKRDPDDANLVEKRQTRHLDVLLNLAAVQEEDAPLNQPDEVDKDNPMCLVRRRKEVPPKEKPSDWSESWPPERESISTPLWFDKDSSLPYPLGNRPALGMLVTRRLGEFLRKNVFVEGAGEKAEEAEPSTNPPFVNGEFDTASYIALRRLPDSGEIDDPDPPVFEAITTEVAVPVDQVKSAINALIQTVRDTSVEFNGESRNVFFPSPLGVRFVAGSHHHLSPEYSESDELQPRAMLEVPMLAEKVGRASRQNLSRGDMRDRIAKPALAEIERELVDRFDGRPHMGKHFTLDRSDLAEIYPNFEGEGGWLETYERFNAFGTFNNEFTDRFDISVDHPEWPDPAEHSDPAELPSDGSDGSSATESPTDSSEGSDATELPTEGSEESDATERPTESSEDSETGFTDTESPGFGIIAGISALGGYAWWRQRDDEESESGGDAE